MIDCAIIIVTWNTWEHVYRCLDALQQQTESNFRILIIDNGISSLKQTQQLSQYSRITYIPNARNVGFAAANNQALARVSDCHWVLLLNPDTVPEPTWFETLMATARAHPDTAMFGCRQLRADDPSILDGDGDQYHVSGLAWRRGYGMPTATAFQGVRETFAPCAAAALYRRDAVVEVSGFDEDYFCYMEDVDLGFRLRLAGHRCLQVADARVLHVGSVSVGRRSDFYVFHSHRNLVWTYFKNMPWPLLWLFLPLHLGLNVFSVFWFSLRGHAGAILRAKIAALSSLPEILRKRRLIQRQRVASTLDVLRAMDRHLLPGKGRSLISYWSQ